MNAKGIASSFKLLSIYLNPEMWTSVQFLFSGPMETVIDLKMEGGVGWAGSLMSQQKAYKISCPKCDRIAEVMLYEAINVDTHPQLKDDLMRNRLNAVICEICEFSFRIDKPLLYNDPTRNWMVYWLPLSGHDFERGEAEFRKLLGEMTAMMPNDMHVPEFHLVFTRTELVERIFLREAGLNERVIEYVKHMIYTKNLKKLNPKDKDLLFNAEDSTPEKLVFVVQDVESRSLESIFEYDRSAYKALCEMFDDDNQTATLLELFPGPHLSARRLFLQESRVQEL